MRILQLFTRSEEQATQSHHSSPPLRPCPRLQAAAQGTSHKSALNLRLGLCHKWLLKRRPFPFKCLPSGDVLSIVLKIVVRFCFSNNARPIQAQFFFSAHLWTHHHSRFFDPQIARVLLRFFASELNFKVLCMLHVFLSYVCSWSRCSATVLQLCSVIVFTFGSPTSWTSFRCPYKFFPFASCVWQPLGSLHRRSSKTRITSSGLCVLHRSCCTCSLASAIRSTKNPPPFSCILPFH